VNCSMISERVVDVSWSSVCYAVYHVDLLSRLKLNQRSDSEKQANVRPIRR